MFVIIMACVHLAGYLLYVEQAFPTATATVSPGTLFQFSPRYWPALKLALVLQVVFGVLTGLMLDGGRSFGFFQVALIGHWIAILLILGRRPLSPTTVDILLIRWGILLFTWSLRGVLLLFGRSLAKAI